MLEVSGEMASVPSEASSIAASIYRRIDPAHRAALLETDLDTLTPRMQKKLAVECMVGLFSQPVFFEKFCGWALSNPGEAAKLVVNLMPKDIHVEATATNSVVLVPATSGDVGEWAKMALNGAIKTAGGGQLSWNVDPEPVTIAGEVVDSE